MTRKLIAMALAAGAAFGVRGKTAIKLFFAFFFFMSGVAANATLIADITQDAVFKDRVVSSFGTQSTGYFNVNVPDGKIVKVTIITGTYAGTGTGGIFLVIDGKKTPNMGDGVAMSWNVAKTCVVEVGIAPNMRGSYSLYFEYDNVVNGTKAPYSISINGPDTLSTYSATYSVTVRYVLGDALTSGLNMVPLNVRWTVESGGGCVTLVPEKTKLGNLELETGSVVVTPKVDSGKVVLCASYTENGVTVSDKKTITIGSVSPSQPTLSSIMITGSANVACDGSATYGCTALMSDGTAKNVSPTWAFAVSQYADFSSGTLTAHNVSTSPQEVTIKAIYTEGGITKSAQKVVTIDADEPPVEPLVIGVDSVEIPAFGGRVSIPLSGGGDWHALPNGDWFTVTEDTLAGGAKALFVFASENTTGQLRQGAVTVTDGEMSKQVLVCQRVPDIDRVQFSAKSVNMSADGGVGQFTVTIYPTVLSGGTSFISYQGLRRSGDWFSASESIQTFADGEPALLTVSYSVEANDSTAPRQGHIYFILDGSEYSFVITQAGVPESSAAVLSLGSTSLSVGADGEMGAVLVSCDAGWSVVSSDLWILLDTTDGRCDGEIGYCILPNMDGASRTGYITVSSGNESCRITVAQSGAAITPQPSPVSLAISGPGAVAASSENGYACTLTMSDGSTMDVSPTWSLESGWNASIDENGLLRAFNDEAYLIEATIRADFDVDGIILSATKVVTINAGEVYAGFEAIERNHTSAGGEGEVWVFGSGRWTASPSEAWIGVGEMSGTGSGIISYTVDRNESEHARTGLIVLRHDNEVLATFTIVQDGTSAGTVFGVSDESLPVGYEGAWGLGVPVKSTSAWSASTDAGWLTLKRSSGSGDGTIKLDVAPADEHIPRTGEVSIANGDSVLVFTVTQSGVPDDLSIIRWFANVPLEDGAFAVTLAEGKIISFPRIADIAETMRMEGLEFDGWWTDPASGEKIYEDMDIEGDLDVYAHWKTKLDFYYDEWWNEGFSTNMVYGEVLEAPRPTRDGYVCVGWKPEVPETVPWENAIYTAQWAKLHSVEFGWTDEDGGWHSVEKRNVQDGSMLGELPIPPERHGYEFDGWEETWENVAYPASADMLVTEDMTIYARWRKLLVITFDANGGETEETMRLLREHTPLGEPPIPVRDGYVFTGWTKHRDGGSLYDKDERAWGDFTFYAQWTEVVSATLNANGGQFGSQGAESPALTETVMVQKGKTIGSLGKNALPTPTRTGYAFAGWWTKKSGGVKIIDKTKVTKNVTYYAHWTVKKFKVAAAVGTKAGGTVSGAGTKKYGSKVALKATPKKGYVFVKWINLNDAETPWPSAVKCRQPSVAFTMGAGNVSVKAVFAKASSDVTPVLTVVPTEMWYVESDPDREISVAADSLSYPAVTLVGAPAGIGLVRVPDTDDQYVLKVTDAAKVKPGVYTAKVTAKNRAGKSVAKSVKIVAPNSNGAVNAGLMAGIEPSTLKPYMFDGGMKMKKTLADLGVEVFQTNGWKLASVTGLPTGLSWNGSAIVGAASKTGVFTVTFTMKKTVKDAKTKKTKTYTSTATATFKIDALLPVTLAGTYNGFANTNISAPEDEKDEVGVRDGGDGDDGEVENVVYTPIMDGWASAVKVTVTAAGKITANIGGAALTGNGFDGVSNGVYAVKLRKTQKITKGSLKGKSKVWEAYIEIDTNATWDGAQLVGWYVTYTTGISSMAAPAWIAAQRNAFGGNADAKAVAAAVAGTRKFTPKSVKRVEWAYDLLLGGKALSVVVKSNGTATLAGKIGSTKVSGTATLEVSGAETVEIVPNDQQSSARPNMASLMCSDLCEDPVLLTRRTATVRFFSGKFIVEVFYMLEDGAVVSVSGRVWKK